MRILVYRLGSLGDWCVALPALRATRQHYPHAQIALLTNFPVAIKAAAAAAVLENTGLIDEFIAYPVGTRNPWRLLPLLVRLRRSKFDVVVNLAAWRGAAKMKRDAAFFCLAGIRERVGFSTADGKLRRNLGGIAEPEAARLLRRIPKSNPTDLTNVESYRFALTDSDRQWAKQTLSEASIYADFIAVSLGTKVPANDWEESNWCNLIRPLGQQYAGTALVFVGAADERERSQRCGEHWPSKVLNLCGACTLRQSAAVLARARLFIGHDSGPMHLAAAVGTPCVAIFAARNPPGQWFPLGVGHRVIYHQTDCYDCGLDVCTEQRKKCILSITVDEVTSAVKDLLNSPAGAQFNQVRILPD
jgi:ADP-heptose:LPS heptosyltransferase